MAIARERLLLAAYIALTCASPDEDSAAIEKLALVSALAIVTNAQIQKSRRFPRLLIVFMLARRYRGFAIAAQRSKLSGFGPLRKRESNSNKRRAEVRCSAELDVSCKTHGVPHPGMSRSSYNSSPPW
jgi:hypothetical protein